MSARHLVSQLVKHLAVLLTSLAKRRASNFNFSVKTFTASCYIKSTGEKKPYRLKWRTGSFYAVNLLRKILVGEYLNDAIAIAGSLDIILPEVDK